MTDKFYSVCEKIVEYIDKKGEISLKEFNEKVHSLSEKNDERIVLPVLWALSGQRVIDIDYADDYEIGDYKFEEKNKVRLVVRKKRIRTMKNGLPHDKDIEETGITSIFYKNTKQNSRQYHNLLDGVERWV